MCGEVWCGVDLVLWRDARWGELRVMLEGNMVEGVTVPVIENRSQLQRATSRP